ncbi:MAG TPA: glycosyltransferase [Pyrinomonadaceae bacterium]|nr:glycosyltransferase [Pyrinomonadaceae bacterium]
MKILWVKTELLHPVDKGGKIRTYNMLKQLKRDHHITYLTLDDGLATADARHHASEYCHELITVPYRQRDKFSIGFYAELVANLFSPLPYAVKKYVSRTLNAQVERCAKNCDVVICDFLAPAANIPCELSAPAILFQHNVEAMIWKRHYQVTRNPLKKLYLYLQWRKMKAFEAASCRRFAAVIAVSKEDREQIEHEYGVPVVFDVPTGVDTDFFRPLHPQAPTPHNLVFTGSMDWLPNEDGIRYFTEEIMPKIKGQIPDATLTVVGRNPYPSLLELAQRDSSIIVTGRVDDVRPFMDQAAVYVVPLRVGGGTRLKIFEAMAMEKPIVSTTVGAEGLPVTDGNELLIADSPAEFASAVVRLMQDQERASQLAVRAAKLVRQQFGWEKVALKFAAICRESTILNAKLEAARQVRQSVSAMKTHQPQEIS